MGKSVPVPKGNNPGELTPIEVAFMRSYIEHGFKTVDAFYDVFPERAARMMKPAIHKAATKLWREINQKGPAIEKIFAAAGLDAYQITGDIKRLLNAKRAVVVGGEIQYVDNPDTQARILGLETEILGYTGRKADLAIHMQGPIHINWGDDPLVDSNVSVAVYEDAEIIETKEIE